MVLGPAALWLRRRAARRPRDAKGQRATVAYVAFVIATSATAAGISLVKFSEYGWLLAMGALTVGLVLGGRRADLSGGPAWAVAHGYGGSYIALVTALSVVAARDHSAALELVAWFAPTAIGVPLILRAHVDKPSRRLAT